MRGAVLYGTGGVRFEEVPRTKDHYMRLGIGPVERSREPSDIAVASSASVRR